MVKPTIFKTKLQQERENRDLAIFNEYNQLVALEGQSKTQVTEHLMKKFGIHSAGTIYVIRNRVAARLEREGKEVAV